MTQTPPGLQSFVPPFPALKRWAKLVRASGATFSNVPFHGLSQKLVLMHTLRHWRHQRMQQASQGDLGPEPTLVMPRCGKLMALPPCAVGGFMSNIKMFPMAMLPGWPFAPATLQAPRWFEASFSIVFSNSIQP